VKVNGSFALKSSQLVLQSDSIEIEREPKKYVSRGGDKLEYALNAFKLSPQDKSCIDVGSSTGGFSDCLLQHGARNLTCVDVGYGLLHEKIKADKRVTNFERTNIRNGRTEIGRTDFTFLTADLSFISLTTVMSELINLCKTKSPIILLVKPQFEATKNEASKTNGVISDPNIWLRTLQEVTKSAKEAGANLQDATTSPILGRSGNKEFFLFFATETPENEVDFSTLF